MAVGITAAGQREVLGIEVGDSEDETFKTAILRRLGERGLSSVQLVVSVTQQASRKLLHFAAKELLCLTKLVSGEAQ